MSEKIPRLGKKVKLSVSGEAGQVIGRAHYLYSDTQCYVHYKAADGCAKTEWFYESQLSTVEDDEVNAPSEKKIDKSVDTIPTFNV